VRGGSRGPLSSKQSQGVRCRSVLGDAPEEGFHICGGGVPSDGDSKAIALVPIDDDVDG
jgi:hypothetical protein